MRRYFIVAARLASQCFASSDETALGCYAAIADFGLSIPTDVSIVGYGNSAYGRYVSPSLTTMSLPLSASGDEAAARLLAQIGDGEFPEAPVHVAPYLVQRLSTQQPAAPIAVGGRHRSPLGPN